MIAVLDRMVWYLRIVYSIDFYNGIEYPNEHEMPHRCGIVHARGVIPSKLPTQTECKSQLYIFFLLGICSISLTSDLCT